MKLSDAKVGMYICEAGSTYYSQIKKINTKSVTPTRGKIIRESELENYIIVDKVILKAQTLNKLFNKECLSLNNLDDALNHLRTIVNLRFLEGVVNIDKDELTKRIDDVLEHIKKSIDKIVNDEAEKC